MSININANLLGALGGLLDDLITSDEERLAMKFKMLELAEAGSLAQIDVNKTEAAHKSMFVAGWRPAVGWTCVAALIMILILFPIVGVVSSAFSLGIVLPVIDTTLLLPLLGGMLGIGGLRTVEKIQGVASDNMGDGVDRRASAAKGS